MENLRQQIEPKMIKKAAADPEFKKALLRDPGKAIEKGLGIALPAGAQVAVKEDGQGKLALTFTAGGRGELPDDLLDKVAGGGTGANPWGA